MLYHATEHGSPSSYGSDPIFAQKFNAISPSRLAFFSHWDAYIASQEPDIEQCSNELFAISSTQRQALGRCINNLVISTTNSPKNTSEFTYHFNKHNNEPISVYSSEFTDGDPVCLSIDAHKHIPLGFGYIEHISTTSVIVSFLQPLKPNAFDQKNRLRIDTDNFSGGLSILRNFLVSVLTDMRYEKTLRLMVDLDPPSFNPSITLSLSDLATMSHLNLSQKNAITHAIQAQDYALILGMPGTGKTTTIAHLIRVLISRGKSILVTAYTHSALDTMLLKIHEMGIPFIRLGELRKVHPRLREAVSNQRSRSSESADTPLTVSEITKTYMASPVIIATTCLSVSSHPIFQARSFDYCILDESSQTSLPTCLGPIRHAHTTILVGDQYQLPPITKLASTSSTTKTNSSGASTYPSLFMYLYEKYPSSATTLDMQYRMSRSIMAVSNRSIYNMRMRCGNTDTSTRRYVYPIPLSDVIPRVHVGDNECGPSCWIRRVLDPDSQVVFVNTDDIPAPETRGTTPTTSTKHKHSITPTPNIPGATVSRHLYNTVECMMIVQLVYALIQCGVPVHHIGIISPYRSQLRMITGMLRYMDTRYPIKSVRSGTSHCDTGDQKYTDIDVMTIDKYQGRDIPITMTSFVRSNTTQTVGDVVMDWRRMNVGVTRSQSKLVMVGSRSTVCCGCGVVGDMVEDCEVVSVPFMGHLKHFPNDL